MRLRDFRIVLLPLSLVLCIYGEALKNVGWLILTALFLVLGVHKLNRDTISDKHLFSITGVIRSINCASGSKDGSPSLQLETVDGLRHISLLEEFSFRTNCDEKKNSLVGKSAVASVLSESAESQSAYQFELEGREIYSLEDVENSDKETGFALILLSLVMVVSLFLRSKNDT